MVCEDEELPALDEVLKLLHGHGHGEEFSVER